MTEPDTDAADSTTSDQFDASIDARDVDDQDDRGPPTACPGCGREVTLMGNGFCGFCQDSEDADQQNADDQFRTDGGTASRSQTAAHPPDWKVAMKAAVQADNDDPHRCNTWTAIDRGDVVLVVHDGNRRGKARSQDQVQDFDVDVPSDPVPTVISSGDIQVDAWEVPAIRTDGGRPDAVPDTCPNDDCTGRIQEQPTDGGRNFGCRKCGLVVFHDGGDR